MPSFRELADNMDSLRNQAQSSYARGDLESGDLAVNQLTRMYEAPSMARVRRTSLDSPVDWERELSARHSDPNYLAAPTLWRQQGMQYADQYKAQSSGWGKDLTRDNQDVNTGKATQSQKTNVAFAQVLGDGGVDPTTGRQIRMPVSDELAAAHRTEFNGLQSRFGLKDDQANPALLDGYAKLSRSALFHDPQNAARLRSNLAEVAYVAGNPEATSRNMIEVSTIVEQAARGMTHADFHAFMSSHLGESSDAAGGPTRSRFTDMASLRSGLAGQAQQFAEDAQHLQFRDQIIPGGTEASEKARKELADHYSREGSPLSPATITMVNQSKSTQEFVSDTDTWFNRPDDPDHPHSFGETKARELVMRYVKLMQSSDFGKDGNASLEMMKHAVFTRAAKDWQDFHNFYAEEGEKFNDVDKYGKPDYTRAADELAAFSGFQVATAGGDPKAADLGVVAAEHSPTDDPTKYNDEVSAIEKSLSKMDPQERQETQSRLASFRRSQGLLSSASGADTQARQDKAMKALDLFDRKDPQYAEIRNTVTGDDGVAQSLASKGVTSVIPKDAYLSTLTGPKLRGLVQSIIRQTTDREIPGREETWRFEAKDAMDEDQVMDVVKSVRENPNGNAAMLINRLRDRFSTVYGSPENLELHERLAPGLLRQFTDSDHDSMRVVPISKSSVSKVELSHMRAYLGPNTDHPLRDATLATNALIQEAGVQTHMAKRGAPGALRRPVLVATPYNAVDQARRRFVASMQTGAAPDVIDKAGATYEKLNASFEKSGLDRAKLAEAHEYHEKLLPLLQAGASAKLAAQGLPPLSTGSVQPAKGEEDAKSNAAGARQLQ